ncbi:MAG TPA: prolyl oligopeptidase family serine peptidase, partial [Roseiflexaceae bacterium]|nr:prolyl oligopeptidase family serine peptidase [Roseiflexaceae bacterium]
MNRRRWFAMMLLFTLLVCAAPAQAADPPLLVDEETKPGPILSEDEVARIRQLQTTTATPMTLSAISPDDAALLIATANGIGFMSVEDGTVTPVDRVVRNLNPSTLLLGLYGTPVAGWRNERVLQYWTTLRTSDRRPQVALVSLDRVSGQIQASAVDVPATLHPVSLAPNASRLLLVEEPPDQESGDANPEELGYVELPSGLPIPASGGLSAAQRAERNAVLQANPWLVPFVPEWLRERGTMAVTNDVLRLWVKDLNSGDLRPIGEVSSESVVLALSWSQDGSRLGLVSTQFDTGDRETATPFDGALIASLMYRDAVGSLPPDENPLYTNNQAQIYNLADGSQQTLRAAGGDGSYYRGISWSTDGHNALAHMFLPGHPVGHRYPSYNIQFAASSRFRFLAEDGHETGRFSAPQVSAVFANDAQFVTPDEVIFTAAQGTNVHPFYYNRVTGEFRRIADRDGSYLGVQATRLSRQIVFTYTSFTAPDDLYRQNWDGSALARLSWAGEELRQFSQTSEHNVTFRLRSGVTRQGVLITPGDWEWPPRNRPIIVWQEGGPGPAMNSHWLAAVEAPFGLLPNFGFGLLVVPVAGRDGTGPGAYSMLANGRQFGQVDIDEMAEIARQMTARRWTTPHNLGITGCSYGGYFTLQSIVRHPDLYGAANA